MSIQFRYFPRSNTFDVVAEHLHSAAAPTTYITNATLKFTVFNFAGQGITGCVDIPMTHEGEGTYRGSAIPTTAPAEGDNVRVLVSCTSHPADWQKWYVVAIRGFDG